MPKGGRNTYYSSSTCSAPTMAAGVNSFCVSSRATIPIDMTGCDAYDPRHIWSPDPNSPQIPIQELKRESSDTNASSPGGIGSFWPDFPLCCLSVHDGLVASGMALATQSTRVRANDPWDLCNSWSLSDHCFTESIATSQPDLVHRLVELGPWRHHGCPGDEYACRARPSPWGHSRIGTCGGSSGDLDAPRRRG